MKTSDINPELIFPYDPRYFALPVPEPDVFDCPTVHLCINSAWVSHIDGLLERLLYDDAWEGAPEEIERAKSQVMELLASLGTKNMSCCCNDPEPVGQRVGEDGILEIQTEPGGDWNDQITGDPRLTGIIYPPLGGSDGETKRCRMANSIVTTLEEQQTAQLQQLQTGATLTDLVAGIVGFLVGISVITGGVSAILAVITTMIAAFLANFTASQFENAFSGATWDQLLCIIYCNQEDDGSFTIPQWQAIMAECQTMIGGTAGGWLRNMIMGMGTVGLANAGRQNKPGTKDCSGCACANDCADKYQVLANDPANGIIVARGSNYIDVTTNVGGYCTIEAINVNDCCYVTGAEIVEGEGIFLSAFELCGVGYTPPLIPNTPIGNCCSVIECQATAFGVLRIFFDECPPE